MNRISAFADEISDDLDEQIFHLKKNGVDNIELRGVFGKNVLKLDRSEIKKIKETAKASGIGFSAVGSPLGKFPLDGDFTEQLEGLKRALEYAMILEAPYVRIFSFYIPKGEIPENHRTQVVDWLSLLAAEAEETNVILAHENEKGIYGDTGPRCHDLFTTIKSSAFTGIFDFANFVQSGQRPYEDCWSLLKPYITYFHIKDAIAGERMVVPAGKGDGNVEAILREAYSGEFDNFLTLEPHLSLATHGYGRTTPELFQTAARALRDLLNRIDAPGVSKRKLDSPPG